MKRKSVIGRIGGLLGVGLLAMLAFGGCERQKIGYVENTQLLNTFDRTVQVRAELQTATARWQAEIKAMEHELDALRQRYVNEHARLTAAEQATLRQQIAEREQAYLRYVQEVNTKAAALEAEKMQPVYQELNTILREYGRRHGYDLILGATSNGNIVYADSASNLTAAVLESLKQRRK